MTDPMDHQEGMKAARLAAERNTGGRSWADLILLMNRAYPNPEAAIPGVHAQQEEPS